MGRDAHQKLITCLNNAIEPLSESGDYSSLLEKIGDARFVMIGEATHGTHEFYQTRIEITQQLIKQKGFMAVTIEGDWPDAHRVHRYLQGMDNNDSESALNDFKRFPCWMWRNTTMPPFLKWLRQHNDTITSLHKVGFYGLDLYSLNASMEAVVNYLMKVDPQSAMEAKNRYSCFDHMTIDPQMYAYLATNRVKKSCIDEVIAQLRDIQHNAFKYLHKDGIAAEDDYFFATQNARIVKNAEIYYRSMFEGHIASWNIRDRHMAETLSVLADHLEHRFNKPAKIIIWAHNSHVGDARATEMGEQGEVNIGQLVREQHTETYSIGFSTYEGFVTAASNWDMPAECKKIVPGFGESYEELFHQLRYKKFSLHLIGNEELTHFLKIPRLQRAIGVIYRPETERLSHYFFTQLPYQFDSLIHFDKTMALQPLPINADLK
ncbi:erythromycin esterase [Legionella nautarum]|uniref:Erythromycin esterase n=1 Tax=Legionella nautarum TaxID=45070 RepID=A0A0W0WLI1_9GAMM|nr:erythromycin esterase family protein [Legionella nautarum]KTD33176.1 erythromycin esterase [Legionella nautarum]